MSERRYPSTNEVANRFLNPPLNEREIDSQAVADVWFSRLSKLDYFHNQLSSNMRWQCVISRFFSQKDQLCDGLFSRNDPRGNFYTIISAILSDSEMRQALLKNIDSVTTSEAEDILEDARKQGNVLSNADVVLVGSGLHATIAGAEMQAYKANINVLYLDAGSKRGGGFRSYTNQAEDEIAVFDINSRHNLPIALNKNDTQSNFAAHLGAISGETFPSQDLLAAVITVNNFLTGRSIQGAFVQRIEELTDATKTTFNYRGEEFTIYSKKTIGAPGPGKTHIPIEQPTPTTDSILEKASENFQLFLERKSEQLPNIIASEDFLRLVATRRGEVFLRLSEKRVIIVGAKDSAQSVLKLLSGYGRSEAYSGYLSQFGRPEIYWMVSDAHNIKLRPQHESLRRELGNDSRFLIHPIEGHAVGLQIADTDIQLIYQDPQSNEPSEIKTLEGNIIIYCTGYKQTGLFEVNSPLDYIGDSETQEIIGRGNNNIYLVGTAADIPLTAEEIKQNPIYTTLEGNSNAMRRLGPKTRRLARHVVNDLLNNIHS